MSNDSKHVVVIGAGVIGLCTAYYCARRGHRVTIIDRNPEERDGCSFGNAGMIVPSHFVPLAAPGMVALGLKWMWNPQSPFYIKPRLDRDLITWGMKFWRAANRDHREKTKRRQCWAVSSCPPSHRAPHDRVILRKSRKGKF